MGRERCNVLLHALDLRRGGGSNARCDGCAAVIAGECNDGCGSSVVVSGGRSAASVAVLLLSAPAPTSDAFLLEMLQGLPPIDLPL